MADTDKLMSLIDGAISLSAISAAALSYPTLPEQENSRETFRIEKDAWIMTSFEAIHLPNLLRTRPNVKSELYMPLTQTIILLKLKHEW